MINIVVLVGRLTNAPELKAVNSESKLCVFTLAVDDREKQPDGNRSTSFFNIVSFGSTAENVAKFCTKGSLVGITGRARQRRYQRKDGTNAYVFEILADSVQFLEPKKQQEAPQKSVLDAEIPNEDDLPF